MDSESPFLPASLANIGTNTAETKRTVVFQADPEKREAMRTAIGGRKESVARKSLVRKLKPAIRRVGQLKTTEVTGRVKIKNPLNTVDNEEVETIVRPVLTKKTFYASLVQFGAEYRIGFSIQFLTMLSQIESELGLYLVKDKVKAKMNYLEDEELAGQMDKKGAKVVLLGTFSKDFLFDHQLLEGDSGTQPPEEGQVDEEFFFKHCFRLPENYLQVVREVLEWKGLVIAKRADAYPISAYPAVFWYATFQKPEDFLNQSKKEVRPTFSQLEEKMATANTWTPGLGLKQIRKILKPKLRYFDRDGSGTIEFDEFKGVMENLGLFLTEARLQKLFTACDLDKSGTVELEELPLALHINDQLKGRARLSPKDAFELFDYDGSGELNEHEFYEVIQTISPVPLSREEATKLFEKQDTDKSGLIEYEEFRNIWLSLCNVESELRIRHLERQREKQPNQQQQQQHKAQEASLSKAEEKNEMQNNDEEDSACEREKHIDKLWSSIDREMKKIDKGKKLKGKALERARGVLLRLVEEEEAVEADDFKKACEKSYQDMRDLRLENDIRKKEQNKIRRREALAARVALSKAERELRRQQKLEESQRKKLEEKERVLRQQLDKELRYREEKERLERKAERELKQKQEKEARAQRGDDRLEMPERGLRQIPEAVYSGKQAQEKLAYLVTMDFSWNKLDEIPERNFLFWCGSLRRLNLAHNRLTQLPFELEGLESLQILNLLHNRLRSLSEEIGSLKSLVSLNLSENELTHLCPALGKLDQNLIQLLAYRNRLETIPPEIGKCMALEILDLSLNALKELPEEMGELTSLKYLDLSWNKLQKFPGAIGRLASLEVLELSGNDLRRLPNTLTGLHSLQVLSMGRNELIEVPSSINGLVSLLKLDVSSNRVIRVPREVGDLKSLQLLDLSKNEIRSLPREIGKLSSLLSLDGHSNRISKLPEEIGALSKLQSLNLSENALVGRVPESIGSLRQLVRCDFSHNQLDQIPSSFGALTALQYLDMSHNAISSLPETIGFMRALEVFKLCCNKLVSIPESIGKMTKLRHVDVSSNLLEWLPRQLGHLVALEHLDLHHNRLRAVPAEVGQLLPHLGYFRVTHNPLSELPPRFASDIRCKDSSQLLWSGYSDGQVGEWLTEMAQVYSVCRGTIRLESLFAVGEGKNQVQTLRVFESEVKAKLTAAGQWKEYLLKHVESFYFKAKQLGVVPRLEALYGSEEKNFFARVEERNKKKGEIIEHVKEESDSIQERMEEAYGVSRQKLIYTESKLDERAELLRKEKRDRFRTFLSESTKACMRRQESVHRSIMEKRERERKAKMDKWLGHFSSQRAAYIEELKATTNHRSTNTDGQHLAEMF